MPHGYLIPYSTERLSHICGLHKEVGGHPAPATFLLGVASLHGGVSRPPRDRPLLSTSDSLSAPREKQTVEEGAIR